MKWIICHHSIIIIQVIEKELFSLIFYSLWNFSLSWFPATSMLLMFSGKYQFVVCRVPYQSCSSILYAYMAKSYLLRNLYEMWIKFQALIQFVLEINFQRYYLNDYDDKMIYFHFFQSLFQISDLGYQPISMRWSSFYFNTQLL